MEDRLILMGVIGKPHGVRGQVRVHAYGEEPDLLSQHVLVDAKGRHFALDWAHDNVAWISTVTGATRSRITDRDIAARLTNVELFLPRSVLPETEEEEFYLADLIGLNAQDEQGQVLGKISNVLDYGAGASLELTPGGLLIPFTRACVPVVKLADGYVVVNPPLEIEAKDDMANTEEPSL
ncbi:ribosome maturation factor RimM [Acidocella facilis]|uniref:ribosome maturation factor RimM n=1 Tax=Acidocella facilis TaxID=525 RepID=UPI00047907FF|nr:ribosome maturation factor RimM [Acidocella facilis]